MSYTSVEQLRNHLIWNQPTGKRVRDQRVALTGTAPVQFYCGAVDPSTVVVKSFRDESLKRVLVILSSDVTALPEQYCVPGSVVVASDSSLGVVYGENEDYIVACDEGRLTLKDSGALAVGDAVVVWYIPWTIYVRDVDYRLDAEKGELTRMAGGRIADGETIALDYCPTYALAGDELLAAAVREANGLVEREVDPHREFGADPVLVCGATYRALEIVCRAAAARDLSGNNGLERTAAVWMKLAADYGSLADRLLKQFRPPVISPASPSRT